MLNSTLMSKIETLNVDIFDGIKYFTLLKEQINVSKDPICVHNLTDSLYVS